jgi:hypothetical protein
VKHLMLRADVVEAAEKGLFHVWPIATVDEAVELLTGLPAGERDASGRYPEGSVNRRVDDRIGAFAERARNFGRATPAAANGAKTAEPPKPPETPPGPPPEPPADPPSEPPSEPPSDPGTDPTE